MFHDVISSGPEIRFNPNLPDSANNKKDNKSKNKAHSGKDLGRGRVLILEDERLVAENLKDIFEETGFEVIAIVSSGEEALDLIHSTHPDLLLLDVRVKGRMDGIETAIAAHARGKLPVIFLTAHSKSQFPQLSKLDPNTFVYVSKPYTKEDLVEALQKVAKSN
jgi:CheY-like chemotaxis protein